MRRHWLAAGGARGRRRASALSERKDAGHGASIRIAEAHLGRTLRLHRRRIAPRRTLARARIPRRYEHCDFENFETDIWEGAAEASRMESQPGAGQGGGAKLLPETTRPASETGLLLMGPCGVGKTHLAVAALRAVDAAAATDARFYDYRELLKELQASYDPDHPVSEMAVLEPVLKAEVLMIDDIGASKPSPWALDTIGHILNKRYNDKRVTLLTTNYLDRSEAEPVASAHALGRKAGHCPGRHPRRPARPASAVATL